MSLNGNENRKIETFGVGNRARSGIKEGKTIAKRKRKKRCSGEEMRGELLQIASARGTETDNGKGEP